MTLNDARLTNRTNKTAVLIGVVLVFVGSAVSAYLPNYGWLLGAALGAIAVFVSLRFQQIQLLKLFGLELNAKAVAKAELGMKVIRKSDASG